MMKRLLFFAGWLAILGNITLISIVAIWLLYPYHVTDLEVPIQIENQNHEISIGESIKMRLRINKPNDYKPDVVVFLTCNDGNLVTLNSLNRNLPKGKYELEVDNYILPAKVNVGAVCTFNFRNDYRVNPIRVITKQWYSEQFKVTE